MPIQVQNTKVWGRLVDAFTLTGRHKLLLDEIIVPVVLVENLSEEQSSQERHASYTMDVAAGIGLISKGVLLNDAGSGVQILIDRVTMTASATSTLDILLSRTAATNPIAGGAADQGWNDLDVPGAPPGTLFADSGVFVGPLLHANKQIINTPMLIDLKLILQPGVALVCQTSTSDKSLQITINARIVSI